MKAPPIETVPRPGVWTDTPADLVGGFLVRMTQAMDTRFPFPMFERIVRTVWSVVQRSQRTTLPLEVKNCGWMITMAGIDFHRMVDGTYMNFEDPVRAPTGAAMHYRLRVEGRDHITGDGTLWAPMPIDMADATFELKLVDAAPDAWLATCGILPGLTDLDDGSCE